MSKDKAPTKTRPRRKKTDDQAPPAPERPSREAYAEFIDGVELRDIRLTESHARSHASRFDSDALKIKVDFRGTIERVPEPGKHGFEAHVTIDLAATDDETREMATIESSYALLYTSRVEPTDGMLDVFLNLNVTVNAWPYLREHVQQTITRFGWNPLILPPLKTLNS